MLKADVRQTAVTGQERRGKLSPGHGCSEGRAEKETGALLSQQGLRSGARGTPSVPSKDRQC